MQSICHVLLVLILAISVQSYPTGPPKEACVEMLPQHKVDAQKTPIPVSVAITTACKGGKKIVDG